MQYVVEISSKSGDNKASFMFDTKEEAKNKMDECREWNQNNPSEQSIATFSYGNKVIDKIQ